MNKEEKKKFVIDLTKAVQDRIVVLIDEGKIPEQWDGHELRKLLADHFAYEMSALIVGKRLKDYKKVLITNGI